MNTPARNRNFAALHPGSGSIFLVLAIISVVLIILGASFFRQAGDSRYITRRQAQSMFLRSFAQAAAHLALVKTDQAITGTHWLADSFLRRNFSDIEDVSGEIDVSEFSELLRPLISAIEREGEFSFRIKLQALKNDFSPTHYTAVFPQEKSGLLRIRVTTSLKGFSEDFDFIAPVKVTAPLIPGLSKFNFYLKNAVPGNDDLFFNRVKNDFRGSLLGGPRPLIFNNGSIPPQDLTWENLMNRPVGFVYLGGGEVRLNLSAASGSDVSDYGESFHFYKRSKPIPVSPFYMWEDRRNPPLVDPVQGNQPTMMLRYDLGVSEPDPADPLRDITAQVFTGAAVQYPDGEKEFRLSSILRLFGSDRNVSPTLVLGEVYRGFLSISAAKVIAPGFPRNEMFIYPRNLAEFNSMLSRFGQGQVARLLFPAPRGEDQLEDYRQKYASGIAYQPYNLSLAFINTRNDHAGPLTEIDGLSPKLARSMSFNAEGRLINAEALDLPEVLQPQVPGKKINELFSLFEDPAMQPETIINSRFAHVIDMQAPGSAPDLMAELKRIGLLIDDRLRLDGWLFVKNEGATLTIDRAIRLEGHGGIRFAGADDLVIKGNIDGSRADGTISILQLVKNTGNIIVDAQKIDAALLTPAGTIQFLRPAQIRGAMIMAEFSPDDSFPGGELIYNPNLALRPENPEFAGHLCFALQTLPMQVNQ